jgi:hypothetical protein
VVNDPPRLDEVWLVLLDPAQGSEIRKTHPCLVISLDETNLYLRTVIRPFSNFDFRVSYLVPTSQNRNTVNFKFAPCWLACCSQSRRCKLTKSRSPCRGKTSERLSPGI